MEGNIIWATLARKELCIVDEQKNGKRCEEGKFEIEMKRTDKIKNFEENFHRSHLFCEISNEKFFYFAQPKVCK